VLSLSKHVPRSAVGCGTPFDKLRANGGGHKRPKHIGASLAVGVRKTANSRRHAGPVPASTVPQISRQ
jgi:hypothetical protein